MENLKAIKDRINTVDSIIKATNAMKMVSTVKLSKINNTNKYALLCAEKLFVMLRSAINEAFFENDIDNNFWMTRHDGKTLVLIMSTDQGFCGSFNQSIIEESNKILSNNKDAKIKVVGRKGIIFGHENIIDNIKSRYDIIDHARVVSNIVVDNIKNEDVSRVIVVSGHFKNVLVQNAKSQQIFPIIENNNLEKREYTKIEGNRIEFIESLFEMYMKELFIGIITEHLISELSSRTMAMDNSVRNAKDMFKNLSVLYNRTRQAKITQELTEIVSSIECVE